MQGPSNPILRPVAITHGHYECRDLNETVPILSHLLALEIVDRRDKQVTLKHPNTEWLLVAQARRYRRSGSGEYRLPA